MFSFVRNSLKKIYSAITDNLQTLFGSAQIDEALLQQLQQILLQADLGVQTTKAVIDQLKMSANAGALQTGHDLKIQLNQILKDQVNLPKLELANVILLVGINGSGKTTLASKLAYYYKQQGKKVLLVAADTFRAAAVDQLAIWADQLNIEMVQGQPNQDPAAVVYLGCERFKQQNYDVVIIDTAGRLQTRVNLMHELSKIRRVVSKVLPDQQVSTLLTIDAMLGQNSLLQAQEFKQVANLNGVVLTKMDGTAKGGIVIAIAQQLNLPVVFVSYGEQVQDLKLFDASSYIHDLLNI